MGIESHLHILWDAIGELQKKRRFNCSEEELISWGYDGLSKAMEKFDEKYGVSFDTYASVRIKWAIRSGNRINLFGTDNKYKRSFVSIDDLRHSIVSKDNPVSSLIDKEAHLSRCKMIECFFSMVGDDSVILKRLYLDGCSRKAVSEELGITIGKIDRLISSLRGRSQTTRKKSIYYRPVRRLDTGFVYQDVFTAARANSYAHNKTMATANASKFSIVNAIKHRGICAKTKWEWADV